MNKIAFLLLALTLTLAACGEEPAPQPTPTVAAPTPVQPSLPAPDKAIFSAALAKACPETETVNTAACKRVGLGSTEVICEYGLGDDTYLRNKAVLTPVDGEWTLKNPETICAAGAE